MEFIDQYNQQIELKSYPKRIISLVPSQTELLYDLGLEEEVIGITKFCVHPKKWHQTKERIGGTKDVNIEKVKALQPDLIIGNIEENTKEDYEQLIKIAPVWMSDVETFEQAIDMIKAIGLMTNKEEKSKELAQAIEQKFTHLRANVSTQWTYLYFMWKDPYLTAGNNTFIGKIIEKLGGINLQKENRYPEINFDTMPEPEHVLLSSEPYPFDEKHLSFFKEKFPNAQLHLVDGEFFCWYGSRLEKAANYFEQFLKEIERVK